MKLKESIIISSTAYLVDVKHMFIFRFSVVLVFLFVVTLIETYFKTSFSQDSKLLFHKMILLIDDT